MNDTVRVQVEDRTLKLSNLEKVLYPKAAFTKGEVIDYYTRIAPILLPHLAGRPLTMLRCPDGVSGQRFFAKNAPAGTPDWVRTVRLPVPGSTKDRETIDFVIIDDLPTLVWAANLASLELHVPMWRVGPDDAVQPNLSMVFDLDPGAPATIVHCCRVACLLRDRLAEDGLTSCAKTSGKKGLHLYVPIKRSSSERASAYAKRIAGELASTHKGRVTAQMTKTARPGKVFIDWSQNNAAKTTVAPYSLRATDFPTVSTPVTWQEIERCQAPDELEFTASEVLDRVAKGRDAFAGILKAGHQLP